MLFSDFRRSEKLGNLRRRENRHKRERNKAYLEANCQSELMIWSLAILICLLSCFAAFLDIPLRMSSSSNAFLVFLTFQSNVIQIRNSWESS